MHDSEHEGLSPLGRELTGVSSDGLFNELSSVESASVLARGEDVTAVVNKPLLMAVAATYPSWSPRSPPEALGSA